MANNFWNAQHIYYCAAQQFSLVHIFCFFSFQILFSSLHFLFCAWQILLCGTTIFTAQQYVLTAQEFLYGSTINFTVLAQQFLPCLAVHTHRCLRDLSSFDGGREQGNAQSQEEASRKIFWVPVCVFLDTFVWCNLAWFELSEVVWIKCGNLLLKKHLYFLCK